MNSILDVTDLNVVFGTTEGQVHAVRNTSFSLTRGETLCIVGESGSGKSVTCQALLGLLPPNGKTTSGSALFGDIDLLNQTETDMERLRGRDIGMIFQDPVASLNPVHRIGSQIIESLQLHQGLSGPQATVRATELLVSVGIPDPEQRLREYPHQLSGGMNQRVMIAIALACAPSLLIADEPTTALDVTIQAQILELLRDLKKSFGMSMLFITHDLGVVAEIADQVVVMRRGEVVEAGSVDKIFNQPDHPYTRELMSLVPHLDAPSPVYVAGQVAP